jgi:hypothetical protein
VRICCGCKFPDREIEEPFRFLWASGKGKIMCWHRPFDLRVVERERVLASSFGIRAQKGSLLSVAEKRGIHHAAKEKGHENTRSTRGEGNAVKKRQADDRSSHGERDT